MFVLARFFRRFLKSDDANLSVITAVFALPLVIVASLAVEKHQLGKQSVTLQSALDAAALSAVSDGTRDNVEKEELARLVFYQNFQEEYDVEFVAKAKDDRIDVFATATVQALLGSIVNIDELSVSGSSTAVLAKDSVTCLLVLDPHGKNALQFSGNIIFNSPNCAVQVNSDHPEALVQSSSRVPVAQNFCTTGGAVGSFDPYVNTQCHAVDDPYSFLPVPNIGACTGVGVNVVLDGTTLSPGTYCEGLTLTGQNIRFLPGNYNIIDGPLTFEKNTTVFGDNVTFILNGSGSKLEVRQGAVVDIRASKMGDYAGVAFYQVPTGEGAELPENTSTLKSNGQLNVTGVLYFPTHEIVLTGQSGFGSQAPATSFIAYRVKMSGRISADLDVNTTLVGLPPFKPRIDGGPRLVK